MSGTPVTLTGTFVGVTEIMLGRASGMRRIDLSSGGFWLSFYGLVLAGLVDTSVQSMIYSSSVVTQATGGQSRLYFVAAGVAIDLVSYGLSMLALYFLVQRLNLQKGFADCVIVHNWAAPVVSLALMPVLFVMLMARENAFPDPPGTGWALVYVSMLSLLIVAGIRLLRISLQTDFARALGLFAASAAVSLILDSWLETVLRGP